MELQERQGIRIAVEGCGHGTLNAIYASVDKACEVQGWAGVDLLIIGGDFQVCCTQLTALHLRNGLHMQAVRNAADLNCMAVPVKYREIGDFYEYYSGTRSAPYLTIFVGGNHEASNHLWELHYGGWVAPNIYYLGAANVIRLGPLRIAGLSGIWKGYNYKKPHYERLPYNQDDVRSIYHVRELDTRKLLQVRTQVDVGMSHDWPRGVEWKGDFKTLFRKKDLFEADAREGNLGSVAAQLVMERLRPPYWFSAHLHIKYAALVHHSVKDSNNGSSQPAGLISQPLGTPDVQNLDEINLDMDDVHTGGLVSDTAVVHNNDEINLDEDDEETDEVMELGEKQKTLLSTRTDAVTEDLRSLLPASFAKPIKPDATPDPPTQIKNTLTRFLSLDKCLPRRDFLQLTEISPFGVIEDTATKDSLKFCYDAEWLAITRVFAKDLDVGDETAQVPRDQGRATYLPLIEREEAWVDENIVNKGLLEIPRNFVLTAPVQDPSAPTATSEMPREYNNPQTVAFCALLGIPNPFYSTDEEREARVKAGPKPSSNGDGGRGGGSHGGRGGRGRGGGGRGRGGRGGGQGRGRGQGRGGWDR